MSNITPKISIEMLETMDKCAFLAEKSKLIPEQFKQHLFFENLKKIPKHCIEKIVIDLELVLKNYILRYIE